MQREAGVHDVLHEQDVPTLERHVDVLEQAYASTGRATGGAGVRGELDDVERVRNRERAREVREEHDARLQRSDEQRVEAVEARRDLGAELRDTRRDLLARQVDVADLAVLGRHGRTL